MRYNKQELVALASQTSQNFEREGVLILKERQDSFFRRSEGYSARWFRLRGNLLFYLKGPEPWYEPLGLIVLGNHQLSVQTQDENGHWPFQIVWTNGVCYHMGTFLESERTLWLKAMELAPYEQMSQRIADLHQQLDDSRTLIDLRNFRITNKIITDFNEIPLCEMSMSCDNLVCDGSGKPPSSFAAAFVLLPDRGLCVRYCSTEVIQRCSNPYYSRTVMFRGSDGLIGEAFIRIVVYDVKEVVSQTGVAMGSVTLRLNHIQEAQRLRIPLLNAGNRAVGFVTINGWSLESPQLGPCPMHSDVERNSIDMAPKVLCHRRSQSLPSRLGLNLKYPSYDLVLCQNFMNPYQATYRFQSGLGGDITVHEAISEPRFCYTMPLQLVNIYMDREKEQLESLLAFAEIGKRVTPRNIDFASHISLMRLFNAAAKAQALFTAHLSVLKVYKTAKKAMMINAQIGFFKPSSQKEEADLGFVPINLHLQRMWVHNATLNKTGFHDVVTVGAFTSHTHRSDKPGGLIKLLQQFKDITSEKSEKMEKAYKISVEYEKLHAMKTLRNAAVDKMEYVLEMFKDGKVNEAPTVVETIKEHLKKYIGLWNESSCEAALSSIGWNKKRIDPETEAVRLTEQLAEHARLAAANEGPLGATGNSSDSSASVFDLIQILAALKTTRTRNGSEATPGIFPLRTPILGITTAPSALETTPGSSSAMEITTVMNASNATSGTSSGLGATIAPNATEATTVASPAQEITNAPSASKATPVASPVQEISNAPSFSKATRVASLAQEISNAPRASKATPVASPAQEITNAPSASKATPVASPAMKATTPKCDSSRMGVKPAPASWQINTELLTKLKIIDSSGSDSTVKVSAALRASLLGPDIGYASEDASGAGPSTSSASQAFSFASSSSSSVETTPTVEMASALSASVPDMHFKGNELQFKTDNTPRGDRSEGSAGSSGKGKGIGKHRKNNSGDGKVNDDNSSNAERADRGRSFRGAIPKTAEVPPPPFERNGSLRSGAKSSTSLVQASKKGPVNNKKDKKKADKKKAKKNRRELEKQVQPRQEIDPAIRLNNLKFFQNMTSAMNDMFHHVCISVDSVIAKGTCSEEDELETKSVMELLVRLMDEAYKWTRMAHAALRIESETPAWTIEHATLQSRRDICFSQALTTVTAGLMCWLTTEPEERIYKTLKTRLGVLCCFEGLLSLYALEKTMWGDMVIAIEDLHLVLFKLVPIYPGEPIIPQVIGFRNAILVELPVVDSLYDRFDEIPTFSVSATFFNIGINEKAAVAEALGDCKQQHHSNADSMDLLSSYYTRYRKVFPNDPMEPLRASSHSKPLEEVMENLRAAVQKRTCKNVEVLQLATLATRLMHGVRFTSCKSAKDRTGMSITLEQTNILSSEYHLADEDRKKALDVMRSEGCRRENALKNIGLSKYAFTKRQVQSLPEEYRPPHGSYGTTLT